MSITNPDFDAISLADIEELVNAGATESQTLEFKRDAYGNADADKKELLKDVSALANTRGGHLVVGIDAQAGAAVAISAVPTANSDAEVLRIESIIRTGIEPSIIGLRVKSIAGGPAGHCVFVVRIPQSWNSPHRVAFQHWNKIFVRHSASVDEASVDELRSLFSMRGDAQTRIREFHAIRLAAIARGDRVRPLEENGRLVAHFVPLAAFVGTYEVDLTAVSGLHQEFEPIGAEGFTPRFNFDGFINERGGDRNFGYTQIFRNGVVEACKANLIYQPQHGPSISAQDVELRFVEAANRYLSALRRLGVPTPIVVLISLEAVQGVHYQTSPRVGYWADGIPQFDRPVLTLPECVIETYGTVNEYVLALRPAFDALWNAMRKPRDEFIQDDGSLRAR